MTTPTTTLVRAASLTHYADVARQAGLDHSRMLRDAGLPPHCLDQPDLRIPAEAVRLLLEHSAAMSGQEAFALLMAEGRRISNLGVLGMLMREEPTLRQAMESIVSYGRTHNQALVHRIEESRGIATLYEELLTGSGGPSRQANELVVAVAVKAMRFFLGAHWRARRICFTHPAPANAAVHRRVLGQQPEFNCDFNGIVCTTADLDTPIASADPVVASYIRQELQTQSQSTMTLGDEVRQIVLALMPRGRCTIEQVAQLLGINRRTLHRRLAAEGLVFSALAQTVRRELALRFASQPQRPLTEVAQLLGFSDLSSFSRWYRAEFGGTATQQRRVGLDAPAAASAAAPARRATPARRAGRR